MKRRTGVKLNTYVRQHCDVGMGETRWGDMLQQKEARVIYGHIQPLSLSHVSVFFDI